MNPCPVCGTEAGENKNYTCAKCGAEVTTPILISAEEYLASLADNENLGTAWFDPEDPYQGAK